MSRRAVWWALAVSAAAQTPPPGSPVEIEAQLVGHSFALHQAVPLRLTVHNRSAAPIVVPDPTEGGNPLRLYLRFPSGKSVTASGERQMPRVPSIPAPAQIPARNQRYFDFDLLRLLPVASPGAYSLRVEYQWRSGAVWRSAEMPFTIGSAAPVFLVVQAGEASRSGRHTVFWGEAAGATQRILSSSFGVQDDPVQLPAAQDIAHIPADVIPAFSIGAPQSPFPDQWLAWIHDGRLNLLYHSDSLSMRLAPPPVRLPAGNASLIGPLLLHRIPANGRPAVTAGIVISGAGGSQLQLAEIDSSGRPRWAAPVPLPGQFLKGWATLTGSGLRFFLISERTASELQWTGLFCRAGSPCGPPVALYAGNAEGVGIAADVRPGPGGAALIGVLFQRAGTWRRVTLSATPSGQVSQPVVEAVLPVCTDASAIQARLDSFGRLGVIYDCRGQVFYIAPRENSVKPVVVPQTAPLLDLAFRPDSRRAVLVYFADNGPQALDLP